MALIGQPATRHDPAPDTLRGTRRGRKGFVMDRITIDLKHCYGIKALKHEFDFTKASAYAIYAPNGAMKSSLAQTFKDAADGTESRDRIFPARTTFRELKDEVGAHVDGDRVLVLLPYDPELGPSEKTCTLLVSPELRAEYEQIHVDIDEAKASLLSLLKQQSSSKTDLESEISLAIMKIPNDLRGALRRLQPEVTEMRDAPFADVKYDRIFSPALIEALNTRGLKASIRDYIDRYDELLDKSIYFSRGTFDFYNAAQIASALAKNGFFRAKHTLNLKANEADREVTTQDELEAVIKEEKDRILSDPTLMAAFNAVERQLDKNVTLREFRQYLSENKYLLPHLDNLEKLKDDIIKSYLKAHESAYLSLIEMYRATEERRKEIEKAAEEQRTQWEDIIDIFNARFVVPFELKAMNRTAVVVGDIKIMELGFTYRDGDECANVERNDLLQSLSTGEKKAFYVLNIMFEVERRRKDGQETLIVIDDVADSFDYQNKYAIVQYMKDISEDGLFKQIILTHNFDFLRTIEGRFVGYANCLMAQKRENGLTLEQASGIKNLFVRDLKRNYYGDDKRKVACVPFLRNLIEFSRGQDDPSYLCLTSMVHWKDDTAKLTVADLDAIYNAECNKNGTSADTGRLIVDVIESAAGACLAVAPGLNLVNKIVLAIAIRMWAERYMVHEIADPAVFASIQSNQTQALIGKFKERFPERTSAAGVLDTVALMTPENIHLNSFMYEPIIDMSDEQLRRLYLRVKELQ
jgi:hypothetical protein